MNPKVSVIVPVYNREKLVVRTLNSILKQTTPPYEIIVVDNNSSDNSFNVIDNWISQNTDSNIKLSLISQHKRGACPARQKGLEMASGNYLIFFDSDDEMLSDLIENATKKINDHPDAEIICWKCRIKRLDGSTRIPYFDVIKPIENHLIHTLLRPQGYMVKKKFLINVGGWEKQVEVWNDFELGLRLLLKNPKIIAINLVLAQIYSQVDSITGTGFSDKEGKWESTLEEMENYAKNSNHPIKKEILRILDYRRAILAANYSKEGNKEGAKKLMEKTLKSKPVFDSMLLLFAYHYTRKGLRGAFRILRPLYSLIK